jgi:hypothetical protein
MPGEYEHFWGEENLKSHFVVAVCGMYTRTLNFENFARPGLWFFATIPFACVVAWRCGGWE